MGVSVGRHLVTSRIISAGVAAFELIDNSEWGFYYCFILPPTLSKLSPTVRFILLVLGNVQILKLFTIYTFICYSLLYIQMMQKLIILNSIWEPLHYLYFNKWKRMDYLAPPPLKIANWQKYISKSTYYTNFNSVQYLENTCTHRKLNFNKYF